MKKIRIIFNVALILLVINVLGCGPFVPYQPSGSSTSSDTRPSSSTSEGRLRNDIVDYAKKYQGAKYKYAGTGPKTFDCSGFTCFVMAEHGINLTHQSGVQEGEGKSISAKDAQPGDLVFFRKSKSGNVFHVALVVSNGSRGIQVIHATSSRGVVTDYIEESSYWSTKYATIRNVIGR